MELVNGEFGKVPSEFCARTSSGGMGSPFSSTEFEKSNSQPRGEPLESMSRPSRLVGCLESAVVVLEDEVFFRDHLHSLIEHAFRRISSRRAAQVSNVRIWDDLSVFVDEPPILVCQIT